MKRILLFILLGILVLTLQTTLLRFFPIQRIRPDFMLIFTLYLGFSFPPIPGAILAFFLGYFVDLFSGNTFGLYTFSRPLLFYGAYLFKSKFYLEGFSSQFIFVFLLAFLEGSPHPDASHLAQPGTSFSSLSLLSLSLFSSVHVYGADHSLCSLSSPERASVSSPEKNGMSSCRRRDRRWLS